VAVATEVAVEAATRKVVATVVAAAEEVTAAVITKTISFISYNLFNPFL
jgi:hypothetical protein